MARVIRILVSALFFLLSTSLASAQWTQSHFLVAIDGAANEDFGISVDCDGSLTVVGSRYDGDNGYRSGSVYLYAVTSDQPLRKLTPQDGDDDDWFGTSVAIRGNLVLVGATGDEVNGQYSGSAYLFDATTGVQLHKLLPDDGSADDHFGSSVAITSSYLVVAANRAESEFGDAGAVYLFDVSTGSQIRKIIPPDGMPAGRFGAGLAVEDSAVLVSALAANNTGNGSGAAYLYDLDTGILLRQYFPAETLVWEDFFGGEVALSATRVLVGAAKEDGYEGAAYLFDRDTGTQIARLKAYDAEWDDGFGCSVAIDGDNILVGAFNDNKEGADNGAVYPFLAEDGRARPKFTPPVAVTGNRFGGSVAISGSVAIVGAEGNTVNGTDSGAAYLLEAAYDDPYCHDGVWDDGEFCGHDALMATGQPDMNHDCVIDFLDMGLMYGQLGNVGPEMSGDLNGDQWVSLADVVEVAMAMAEDAAVSPCTPDSWQPSGCEGTLALSFDPNQVVSSIYPPVGFPFTVYVLAIGVEDARIVEFALEPSNELVLLTSSSSLGWQEVSSEAVYSRQCWTGTTPASGTVAIAQYMFMKQYDGGAINLIAPDLQDGRISWANSDFVQRVDFAATSNVGLDGWPADPGISTCVDPNLPPELTSVSIGEYLTIPTPVVPVGTTQYLVYGNASDPDGTVVQVEYRVVDGDWQTASGTTSWSALVDLVPGENRVEIRALDDGGATSPIHGGWVIRETEPEPLGTAVTGVVFADLDENGLYDPASEVVIGSAVILLDGDLLAQSDAQGGFGLDALQAGPGHRLEVSATGFATFQMENLRVPTVDSLSVGLAPLADPNYALWEINPAPEPGPLVLETGGTLTRYYRVVDENTGLPVGNVPVTVQTPAKTEQVFSSMPDGTLACGIPQSLMGPAGSMQSLAVVSIADEELSSPAFTQCEIVVRPAETSFLSWGAVSATANHLTGEVGERCVVTLINEDGIGGADRIRIQPGVNLAFGMSAGVGEGFELEIGGPVDVHAEAQVGASVEGKVYANFSSGYEFAWPPASEEDANEMYQLLAGSLSGYLDGATSKILLNASLGEPVVWDSPLWHRAENGLVGGQEVVSQVGVGNEQTDVDFRLGAGLEATERGYIGATSATDGEILLFAGLSAMAEWGSSAYLQIPEPSKGNTSNGAARLVRSVGQVNERGSGVALECWIERPDWHSFPSELGYRTSILGAGDGTRNTHESVFIRSSGLLQRMVDAPVDLFVRLIDMASGAQTLSLYDGLVLDDLLTAYSVVAGYQDLFSDGSLPEGEGLVMSFERENELLEDAESENWSVDLKVDIGEVSGEISTYALRQIAHRNLVEKGEWRSGRRLVTASYPEQIERATTLTYKQVLQEIVDNLPFWTRVGIRTGFLDAPGKAAVDTVLALQDGLSTLTVNPADLPAGAKESFWTWTSNDVSKSPALSPRQAASAKALRAKLESSHGMIYGIGGFHQFEPEGEDILSPATLSLAYADSELAGLDAAWDESQLAVYYEDKTNHRYIYLGGAVDTVANRVTVPVSEMRLYTLGPRVPSGEFVLAPDLEEIPADGSTTTLVSSNTLINNDGSPVPDGTLYTVTASNGTILDGDLAPDTEGRQVAVNGGVVSFLLQASDLSGRSVLQARSLGGFSAASDTIAFIDMACPAPPSGLRVSSRGLSSLGIAWDECPDADVAGYRIYFDSDSGEPPFTGLVSYGGLASPFDVARDTAVTIVGLDPSTDYYVTVTAYDVAGKESPYPGTVLSTATTPVSDEMPSLQTTLGQNIPNPFNPLTTIAYTLPVAGPVRLKIFDVRGRLVKTLVQSEVAAGNHEVVWHGDDRWGRQVSSGVYLYLLQTGAQTRTRKMVVIR